MPVQLSMCQLSNDIMTDLSDCSRDNCLINYWQGQWTVIDSLKLLHAEKPVAHLSAGDWQILHLTFDLSLCVCREDFPHVPTLGLIETLKRKSTTVVLLKNIRFFKMWTLCRCSKNMQLYRQYIFMYPHFTVWPPLSNLIPVRQHFLTPPTHSALEP